MICGLALENIGTVVIFIGAPHLEKPESAPRTSFLDSAVGLVEFSPLYIFCSWSGLYHEGFHSKSTG